MKTQRLMTKLITAVFFTFLFLTPINLSLNAQYEPHSDEEPKEIWEGCATCPDGQAQHTDGVCPNTPPDGGGGGDDGDGGGDDSGGGGECTDAEVPDMIDIGIDGTTRAQMIANCGLYKQVAAEYCMPWQMLMAIHYREGGLPDQSMKNGFPLCNDIDTACPPGTCDAGATQLNDARCAASILKDKFNMVISGGWASGDPCNPDDNLAKWAFYFYNSYRGYPADESTYAMSKYPGWGGESDANAGAFTVYAKLRGRF